MSPNTFLHRGSVNRSAIVGRFSSGSLAEDFPKSVRQYFEDAHQVQQDPLRLVMLFLNCLYQLGEIIDPTGQYESSLRPSLASLQKHLAPIYVSEDDPRQICDRFLAQAQFIESGIKQLSPKYKAPQIFANVSADAAEVWKREAGDKLPISIVEAEPSRPTNDAPDHEHTGLVGSATEQRSNTVLVNHEGRTEVAQTIPQNIEWVSFKPGFWRVDQSLEKDATVGGHIT